MNSWVKLAFLAVAAVVVVQLFMRQPQGGFEPGAAAPPLRLADLDGNEVDLASLRGKVVAVNFWATWCPPCQMEIPDLAAVWTGHRGSCFELLGVAGESAREDVLRMLPGVPYPILLDERADALRAWGGAGYPRTVVVDADGKVRKVFQGMVGRRELEETIRPLLPASCPAKS